jgi:oligopeptide transport system substrate-binding protein
VKNLLLSLLVLVSLTSCQNKERKISSAPSLKKEANFLRLNLAGDVNSLDPRQGYNHPSCFFVKLLFEGLMRLGPNGEIIPGAAASYEVSEDRKTYTFHLRPSKWTDGSEVTAYDFEYAWKKIVTPASATRAAHNFYSIKNVQAALKGEVSVDEVGIRAIDCKTFVVELEYPAPYFLEAITTAPFRPIPSAVDQKDPQWASRKGRQFICNGPFRLKGWAHNNLVTLIKNSHYWRKDKIRLPGIAVSFVKEEVAQLMMFEKGELDWVGRPLAPLPLDALATLKKEGKFESFPACGLHWYFFNTETFPFNNKKMRLAFAYAINRREIVENMLQGDEQPAMGIFTASLALQQNPYFSDNDVTTARVLFDEALQEMGLTRETCPQISLSSPQSEANRRLSQIVQQQWNQAFGISVKLDSEEWKVYYDKVAQGNYQVAGMNWMTWIKDPIYILQIFKSKSGGMNMPKWEDARYQALLDASDQEIDTLKRRELLHQAEKLLLEEMPVAPVYFLTMTFARNPRLKNTCISDLSEVDFTWAHLE